MIKRYQHRQFNTGKEARAYKMRLHSRLTVQRRLKLIKLSEAQNHRCAYCCKETHLNDDKLKHFDRATLEHLIPISEQVQTNKDENLVMACGHCNTIRGTMDPMEFYEFIRKKPEKIEVVELTEEQKRAKEEKANIKINRGIILAFIIINLWPLEVDKIIKHFESKKRRRPIRKRSAHINDIRHQIRQDQKALIG